MLIKVFGLMDLLAAIVFASAQWGFGLYLGKIIAIYLIVKSLLFITDFASWVDFLSGIIILISIILQIPSLISIVHGILIIQKGLFSFK